MSTIEAHVSSRGLCKKTRMTTFKSSEAVLKITKKIYRNHKVGKGKRSRNSWTDKLTKLV